MILFFLPHSTTWHTTVTRRSGWRISQLFWGTAWIPNWEFAKQLSLFCKSQYLAMVRILLICFRDLVLEFILTLSQFFLNTDFNLDLRQVKRNIMWPLSHLFSQLSLVLIMQQCQKRLKTFPAPDRAHFLQVSLFALNSSPQILKNGGVCKFLT